MAGSLNKVSIIGRLTANPELKQLPSGQSVCEMRVATNEVYTDKQNQKQERTEYHSITVWAKTADVCAKYLEKGRQVYVEGKIRTRSWQDKTTGEKKYKTEIIADDVIFLDSKSSSRPVSIDTETATGLTTLVDETIPF